MRRFLPRLLPPCVASALALAAQLALSAGPSATAPAADDAPWFVSVPGHRPVADGEHPRLLFRRRDLDALRAKAATPQGQAILRRLRFLLDGADGQSMTARFNPADRAYSGRKDVLPPGTYTFGHAAGYGLLYQLTGDAKYAAFGRDCFEKALAGVRDRDDRYAFRRPGGPLRAGPVLGWMAVGYDLCYDGWDAPTREKMGRALLDYHEQFERRDGRTEIGLDDLARGTMPPGSNHFGMQVGGAALVLLAVAGEPWAPPDRIETLLRTVEQASIRNLAEGFGDGGFFAEGDGTGSMSSQIVFLTALQAWRNAVGKDFFTGPRPNARMLTLKWMTQTVFRDGQPGFWPVRGAYPDNVWKRDEVSGAGYFAIGFGAVRDDERGALLWCYDRFLAAADEAAGTPCDTVTLHPQLSVSAFIHWPVGQPSAQPDHILPRAYRDTRFGFYCWRNRWRDAGDTVVTVLTQDSHGGYMRAHADKTLFIASQGRHLAWGRVAPGPARHWWTSPDGDLGSLTLADGTAFAIDFSGACGADVMLVTTGPADGRAVPVDGGRLTFLFPTTDAPPEVRSAGAAAIVGARRIEIENGNLVLRDGIAPRCPADHPARQPLPSHGPARRPRPRPRQTRLHRSVPRSEPRQRPRQCARTRHRALRRVPARG